MGKEYLEIGWKLREVSNLPNHLIPKIPNIGTAVQNTLEDIYFPEGYINLDEEYIEVLRRYKFYNEIEYNRIYKLISFKRNEENNWDHSIVLNLDWKDKFYSYANKKEFTDNIIKINNYLTEYGVELQN